MQSNEVRIPKADFDFSPTAQPCQYFKSSYARSLSFSSGTTKSLDIAINFGLKEVDIDLSPPSLGSPSRATLNSMMAARSLLFTDTPPPATNDGDSSGEQQFIKNIWLTAHGKPKSPLKGTAAASVQVRKSEKGAEL